MTQRRPAADRKAASLSAKGSLGATTSRASDAADEQLAANCVQRFLLPSLNVRGAIVKLGEAWRQMQAGRGESGQGYPVPVTKLLGEMAAVTALLASQMKQEGRLGFQMQIPGRIQLLLTDCDELLNLRGMARFAADLEVAGKPLHLEANGQLMMTLESAGMAQAYQSIVPLSGDSLATVFRHFFVQSEQQEAYLQLSANAESAAALFLQKMPTEGGVQDPGTGREAVVDADAWNRLTQLAATLSDEELQHLGSDVILRRLFGMEMAEHDLLLFPPRKINYHCPLDWEKIRDLLIAMGRSEVEELLDEQGEILIQDEMCNHDYRFKREDLADIFNFSVH